MSNYTAVKDGNASPMEGALLSFSGWLPLPSLPTEQTGIVAADRAATGEPLLLSLPPWSKTTGKHSHIICVSCTLSSHFLRSQAIKIRGVSSICRQPDTRDTSCLPPRSRLLLSFAVTESHPQVGYVQQSINHGEHSLPGDLMSWERG